MRSDVATPRSKAPDSPAGSAVVDAAVIDADDPALPLHPVWTPRSFHSAHSLPVKRRRTNDSDHSSFHSISQSSGFLSYARRRQSHSISSTTEAIDSLLLAADYSDGLNRQVIAEEPKPIHSYELVDVEHNPETNWPRTTVQEACLLRYFIDELACWVSS